MGVSIVTSAAAWVPTWLALSAEVSGGPLRLVLVLVSGAIDNRWFPYAQERHALPSLLGLRPGSLQQVAAAVVLALALTAVLFAGPLYMLVLDWQAGTPLSSRLPVGLAAWRNLLVAPLTEEFVFRSCLVSFLLVRGVSPRACIFLSPLAFGASHVHHLYDLVRYQGYPWQQACLAVLFQMCYTSLFGWYATVLFLRTASLAAVVVVHSFCNFLGFPPLLAIPAYPRPAKVVLVYCVGIAVFILLLRHLTWPTSLWADKEGLSLSPES